jgi:hypothetical protein
MMEKINEISGWAFRYLLQKLMLFILKTKLQKVFKIRPHIFPAAKHFLGPFERSSVKILALHCFVLETTGHENLLWILKRVLNFGGLGFRTVDY